MTDWTIEYADVMDWAAGYEGEPFHALLCDPPYQYSFMSKKWDGTGISFQPEVWAALAEHLYSGAFGMTFAGARTFHRIAVAIEDAGLRLHPALFGWSAGSGFPKATQVKFPEWLLAFVDDPFNGHRYGLQALKPALEPIIVFQKPYAEKPVESITRTGAGALNIDGARIGIKSQTVEGAASLNEQGVILEDGSFLEWCECDHD